MAREPAGGTARYTFRMNRAGGLLLAAGIFGAMCQQTASAQDRVIPNMPRGVTEEVRKSTKRGLNYLAREQQTDGSWRHGGSYGHYPVAMTGLAGLALVGSGSTPTRGPYSKNVRLATRYLIKMQQPNGLITAPNEESRSMYGHGFSTLFLAQVYGMEEDVAMQRRLRLVLRKAVVLIERSQSVRGGWLYTPDSRSDEGSVTVTQVQALRACRNAGIYVPKKTIGEAINYLKKCQNADGGISYSVNHRSSRPALTAAACAVLYNAGEYDSDMAVKAWKYAWRHAKPSAGRGHWFYTQLYMSQATWQKGDKFWDEYYKEIRDRLIAIQQGNGSWRGDGAGMVYGTAIALLIMQLPYNHLPILSR